MLGGTNVAINLPGGWDRVRDMIRENQASMPIFARAPTVIQETLIFPYLSGAEFVRNFKERNPGKSIYSDMPVSTEQILHPTAFFGKRDMPTAVTLPPLVGAATTYSNTLGEFETRLFLFQSLNDQNGINNEKSFQIRGTLRPAPMVPVVQGLRVTGYYDTDHYFADAKRERVIGSVTFEIHTATNSTMKKIWPKRPISTGISAWSRSRFLSRHRPSRAPRLTAGPPPRLIDTAMLSWSFSIEFESRGDYSIGPVSKNT